MLGLIRSMKWILILVLLLLVGLGIFLMDPAYVSLMVGKIGGNLLYGFAESLLTPIVGSFTPDATTSQRITIDVLNEHETVKLITREVESRLVFEETQKYGWLSTLVGERKGILRANITFVYGVNVKSIKPDHITVTDRSVIVDLPPLRPLYVIPDINSIEYESESSLINQLIDRVHDLSLKQEIYRTLQRDARQLTRIKDLKPDENDIFSDLETTLGPLIQQKTGRELHFQ